MNQTWENSKKPNFELDFGPFGPHLGSQNFFLWDLPLLDIKYCCKLSLYAISRKMYDPIPRKHSWQRGPNPPLFYEPYCQIANPVFFKFCPTRPSFLLPPTLTPTALSVVMLLWLNGWLRHIWCVILLNDIKDLHMSSLGTWCVFYASKCRVYWGLTHNVGFCW